MPEIFRPPLSSTDPELMDTLLWIRSHTEADATLLTPPYLDGIRLLGERAIVVDIHSHGFTARELQAWENRLEAVTHQTGFEQWNPSTSSSEPQRDFLRKAYLKLSVEDVEKIVRDYKVEYFLTEASYPFQQKFSEAGYSMVFKNKNYVLFSLKK